MTNPLPAEAVEAAARAFRDKYFGDVGGAVPLEELDSATKQDWLNCVTAALLAAYPAIREAVVGEDAKRLDWIEATARDKFAVTIGEVLQQGCRCLSCWEYGVMDEGEKLGRGETVRAAIDAALTEQESRNG